MLKARPKIVLRTRPSDRPSDCLRVDSANQSVTVSHGGHVGLPSDRSAAPQEYAFKFDAVLHNAPQEAVFEECAADVVRGALEGYNGTILCYGQTGAGKTFTMTGDRTSYERRGLIPRTVAALMAALREEPGVEGWRLRISYLEIYNEAMFDLLDPTTQPHEITLYEDGAGRLVVGGLRAAEVRTEHEALTLFFEGEANRVIGEHQLNRESSRSHCVFTAAVEITREGAEGRVSSSAVTLVDLAGSERVSKTRSEGLVLREAGRINRSLHLLEQVVLAASERGRDHIPYRSCRLTHVLRDSIGGNCRTVLVANVWADAAQLEETMSTCRFAARMARITCQVSRNVAQPEGGARMAELEREVRELLEELAMRDLWSGRTLEAGRDHEAAEGADDGAPCASGATAGALAAARARYGPYTHARRMELREAVRRYLLAGAPPAPDGDGGGAAAGEEEWELAPFGIDSARRLREVLRACKDLFGQVLQQGAAGSTSGRNSTLQGAAAQLQPAPLVWPATAGAGTGAWQQQQQQQQYVGEEEEAGGATQSGGAGIAPDNARPGGQTSPSAAAAATAWEQQQQQQRPPPPALGGPAGGGDWRVGEWPAEGSPASGSTTPASTRAPPSSTHPAGAAADPLAPDAAAAALLERYRAGPGAAKAALLNENHAKAKAARRRAREAALRLNELKRGIDGARAEEEGLRAARLARGGDDAQVAAPDELAALATVRDLKAAYRDARGDHQLAASEAEYAAGLAEACRLELTAEFEAWAAARAPAAGGGGGGGAAGGSQQQQAAGWGRAGGGGGDGASSRAASAASGASMLLGGLGTPLGGAASPAGSLTPSGARTPQQLLRGGGGGGFGGGGFGAGPGWGGGSAPPPPVPLASLVAAAAADAAARGDAGAAAYFGAQAATAGGGGARLGSAKKHRGERGTFSVTQRSAITEAQPR